MAAAAQSLGQFYTEYTLSSQLRALTGVYIFEGATTEAIRKQRARAAIGKWGIGNAKAGTHQGQPVTFNDMFAKIYEPDITT